MSSYKVLYLFAGIGGGALGFQEATEEYKGVRGQYETLVGIDCDPDACEDFRNLTGAPAVQMDLFERRDYVVFHGKQPPPEWQEITPEDIREVCNGQAPDVIFTSPPCKGFSGLLPEKSAKTEKYQALNRLVVRGLFITLEAFRDDLPAFILLENVPRITTRGAALLHTVKGLLQSYGYLFHEGNHDCGEIGGLGQHRKRYLLVARNPNKICQFVYKPPIQRVKSIREILGPLPMPDDPIAGPLHRLPRLQWKTWMRLALIPAGGDWRDLEKIAPEQYRIEYVPRKSTYGVQDWNEPAATVIGNARVGGSQASAVADPRLSEQIGKSFNGSPGLMGVIDWNKPTQTVTGSASVSSSNCPAAIMAKTDLVKWDEPGPCATGTRFGSGAPAIADPRTGFKEGTHGAIYRVSSWDEAANTVTGAMRPNNGAISIADPRVPQWRNGWKCTGAVGRISKWDSPTDTVIGHSSVRGNGAANVADPRLNCKPRSGTMGVQAWDKPGATVIGAGDIHAGAVAVADPRIPADTESGVWVIISTDGTWHRPLTTLELAALQGFPLVMPDGRPLQLAGKSDAKWRERIGNAVPPPAARAIAETVLRSLLASWAGEWLMSSEDIWVMPGVNEDADRSDRPGWQTAKSGPHETIHLSQTAGA